MKKLKDNAPQKPRQPERDATERAIVTLSMHPEQLRNLDLLARSAGSTRSSLVKIAIARLLRDGI